MAPSQLEVILFNIEMSILPNVAEGVLLGLRVEASHLHRPKASSPELHLPRKRPYRTLLVIDGANDAIQDYATDYVASLKKCRFLQEDCFVILLEDLRDAGTDGGAANDSWFFKEMRKLLKHKPFSLPRSCANDQGTCAEALKRAWKQQLRAAENDDDDDEKGMLWFLQT